MGEGAGIGSVVYHGGESRGAEPCLRLAAAATSAAALLGRHGFESQCGPLPWGLSHITCFL